MPRASFELNQRVALLTGGGGILGAEMAHGLASHGATVVVADCDQARAEAVVSSIRRAGGEAVAFRVDVTDADQVAKLAESVEDKVGEVQILINNAATKSPKFFEPFESFPLDDWNHVLNANLTGVMLGCQVFGRRMAERGEGCIINTLSVYGILAPDQRIYAGSEYEGHPINTPAVYSASKAAVWGLTKYLATYWGDKGVRVNAITPGGVFSGQNETFVRQYSARVPMGRMGRREELVGAVIYLASDAATYVTGQNIIVDGGLSVW